MMRAAWLLVLAAGHVHAVPNAKEERERIALEQAEAERVYREREAVCRSQFIVTSCVEKARTERRQTLNRLRDQKAALDDAQRRERAAARLQSIEEKQREAALRTPTPPASAASGGHGAPVPNPSSGSSAARAAAASAAQASEAAKAAERAEARRTREAEAERHRANVEARNAERAAQGRQPATLPIPKEIPAAP